VDIGPEQAPFIAEPLEDPFRKQPAPEPEPRPAPAKPREPEPARNYSLAAVVDCAPNGALTKAPEGAPKPNPEDV
jgi:hypothetical protein